MYNSSEQTMLAYIPIICFWGTYFFALYIFPTGSSITRTHVEKKDVVIKIIKNMIASVLMIKYINYIPTIYEFSNTWGGLFYKLLLGLLVMEVWFYYAHRLLHHPLFYRFHKDHHIYIQSDTNASLYCSIVEMVLSNQLSVAVPFRLFAYNTIEMSLVSAFVALNVIKGHATFQNQHFFPEWIPVLWYQNWDHDNHHRLMNCNFGLLSLLDRIHGTRYERIVS